MDLLKITKNELYSLLNDLPYHSSLDDAIPKFHSMLILPADDIHDSNYRCMWYIPLDRQCNPICKCGGGSDVLHFERFIGRPDEKYKFGHWSIDCLPCGVLRVMNWNGITLSCGFSDFEIMTVQDET